MTKRGPNDVRYHVVLAFGERFSMFSPFFLKILNEVIPFYLGCN